MPSSRNPPDAWHAYRSMFGGCTLGVAYQCGGGGPRSARHSPDGQWRAVFVRRPVVESGADSGRSVICGMSSPASRGLGWALGRRATLRGATLVDSRATGVGATTRGPAGQPGPGEGAPPGGRGAGTESARSQRSAQDGVDFGEQVDHVLIQKAQGLV
jgi:hypothetical protein